MSTRAIIKVEGSNLVIEKHFDGDPETMEPLLDSIGAELQKRYKDNFDTSYILGQLIIRLGMDNTDLEGNPRWDGIGIVESEEEKKDAVFCYTLDDEWDWCIEEFKDGEWRMAELK